MFCFFSLSPPRVVLVLSSRSRLSNGLTIIILEIRRGWSRSSHTESSNAIASAWEIHRWRNSNINLSISRFFRTVFGYTIGSWRSLSSRKLFMLRSFPSFCIFVRGFLRLFFERRWKSVELRGLSMSCVSMFCNVQDFSSFFSLSLLHFLFANNGHLLNERLANVIQISRFVKLRVQILLVSSPLSLLTTSKLKLTLCEDHPFFW